MGCEILAQRREGALHARASRMRMADEFGFGVVRAACGVSAMPP